MLPPQRATPPPFAQGIRERRDDVAFDEAAWPCIPPFAATYEATCRAGAERMAGSRAVLCGLARDVERELPLNLARLGRIGGDFADHRILIYENDSIDGTPKLLAEAADRDDRVTAILEADGSRRWPPVRVPARAYQMARYRERLRREVVERFGDFDFVIVADLDLEGWSYDGIRSAFGREGWHAMASMGVRFHAGRPFFYDSWAFRALGQEGPHGLFELRSMIFPRGTPPLAVRSAFSGLAIYPIAAFAAGRYAGPDCEHVPFHASMAEAGFDRIFLNPSMLSLYPDFGETPY